MSSTGIDFSHQRHPIESLNLSGGDQTTERDEIYYCEAIVREIVC